MTSLLQDVDRLLADPLAHGRQEAAAGKRLIGVTSSDVPVELIRAAGALPLALPTQPGTTPRADIYLEATFSPAARSLTEQWLSGAFDFLQAVVFPRSNDSLQRIYYYWCELQRRGVTRGPRPLLFDVAKIPRATSISHTRAATRRLAAVINSDRAALPDAIAHRNRRRRLMQALRTRRLSDHASPSGPIAEHIMRACDWGNADTFDAQLEAFLAAPAPKWHGPRLLLVGTPPPDDRLHVVAEASGARIVDEFGDHGGDRWGTQIPASGEPLEAIADHHATLRTGSRSFGDRATTLVARARAARVDGVVLWIIEEDESIVWDVPAMKRALSDAKIPLLELTRRAWNEQETSAMTQFIELLGNKP